MCWGNKLETNVTRPNSLLIIYLPTTTTTTTKKEPHFRMTLSSLLAYKQSGRKKVIVTQSCPTLCHPMDYTVHGILQARVLEWGSLPLLQGIFPTQGWNPGLPHCRQILNQLSHRGSPLSCRLEPNSTLGSMFHPHPSTVASVYLFGVFSTQLASVDMS